MASQKNESGQQEPFSADPTSRSDSDIVELLWEDGQIMMQGQSSRATKTPLNTFPSNTNKPRTRKLSAADSVPHDVSRTTVPSQDMDLSQDNDMDSWFDSLTHDYGSVFLPEIPGVAPNTDGMLAQNSFSLVDKRGNFGQDGSNLQQSGLGSSKASGSKDRQLSSWPPPLPHHHQTSSALGSGVSGIVNNMGSHSRPDVFLGNPAQSRDTRPPTNNSANYLNFSHFARSASLVKANASNSVKEKSSGGKGIIPTVVKSTLVEGFNSVSSGKSVVTKAIKDSISCPSENLCQETTPVANDDPSTQSNAIESAKGVPCKERIVEHVVASSSVGSGNSADRVSCEQTHNSKRKYRDAEDSEDRSEDVGVEKTTLAGGNGGSKRSRAAEVHNLSERRRRDRINEKMRALQELIPNSNKADKASMLDEAIEYLKTLQHQVQVMSLGAGLCMPQMMFPQGMQHMHPARIPHFSQMGPAGMGIGFGMGMLDINGGFPVFPVSSLHPPHFSTSLPTNFHRIPSPNLPVYGHPIQGLPLTGQPSHVNSAIGLSGLRNGSRNTVLGTSPVLNSGVSPLLNCYTEANQPHATEDVLNQSATARENEDAARASSLLTMTLPATDVSKEPFEQ